MGEVSTTQNNPAYICISCKVADFLPLESIKEFQGSFNKRIKKEFEKIIVSVIIFSDVLKTASVTKILTVKINSKLKNIKVYKKEVGCV